MVKVLDLGLARFTSELHQEGELTQTGQVMGTPDYIAPEQAQRTKEADIRSDIFSLGCTLFRMLTGQLPFQGANVMEKLMARAMADAPRLRQFAPELPADREEIVARMLARDRTQRYQTPAEVARALERYGLANRPAGGTVALASQPTTTRTAPGPDSLPSPPVADGEANEFLRNLATNERAGGTPARAANLDPGVPTPLPLPQTSRSTGNERPNSFSSSGPTRDRSRNRNQWGLVIAIAGLVPLALLGAFVWNHQSATHLVIDWPEDERARGSLEVDGRQLPLPARGEISTPAGRAGKRTVRLARPGYEEIALELDFARGESRTVRPEWRPTTATVRKGNLAEIRRGVDSLARRFPDQLIPDEDDERRRLAARYREVRRELVGTVDLPGLEALWRKLPSPLDRLAAGSVSLLDRQIVEESSPTATLPKGLVAIWGDGRLKPAALWGIERLVVDPTGKFALTVTSGHLGTVWDLGQGIPWMTIPGTIGAAFSPDGKTVALVRGDVEIWSLATRKRTLDLRLSPEYRPDFCVTYVPGSSLLAVVAGADTVVLWDLEQNEFHSKYSLPQETQRVTALAASPDGQWLCAAGVDGILQLWNLADGSVRTLERNAKHCNVISFRPDSRVVAAGAYNSVLLWSLPNAEPVGTIRRENFGLHSLSWSRDGTSLAGNSIQGGFQLWDPQSGACTRTVTVRGSGNIHVQYTAGDCLVACAHRGDINIWETPRFEPEWNLPAQVTCADIDPCGEWLAVATTTPTLELRRLDDGTTIREWRLQAVPAQVIVRPDGRQIAVQYGGAWPPELFDPQSDTSWSVPTREGVFQCVYASDNSLVTAGPRQVSVWEGRGAQPKIQATIGGEVVYQGLGMGLSAEEDWVLLVGALPGWKPILEMVHRKTGEVRRQGAIEHATHILASPTTRNYLVALNNYGLRVADGSSLEVIGTGVSQEPPPERWTSLCPVVGRPGDFVASAADGRVFCLTMGPREVTITRTVNLGGAANSARQIVPAPDGRHLILVMANGTLWVVRDLAAAD